MSSSDTCIFCKIVAGTISSPRVYEDSQFICIRDIQPQAKTHLLLIPKVHLPSLVEANANLMGPMMELAVKIAHEQGLLPQGFRTVINTGEGGGQTVFHLHVHLLGGGNLRGEFA
jgi:histidine triad (HIT) family protein